MYLPCKKNKASPVLIATNQNKERHKMVQSPPVNNKMMIFKQFWFGLIFMSVVIHLSLDSLRLYSTILWWLFDHKCLLRWIGVTPFVFCKLDWRYNTISETYYRRWKNTAVSTHVKRVGHAVLDRCKQCRDRRLKRVRSQSLVEPCCVSPPLVKSSLRGQLLLTGEWLSSLFATVILIVATKECDEYSIVNIITAYLSCYTFKFISRSTFTIWKSQKRFRIWTFFFRSN